MSLAPAPTRLRQIALVAKDLEGTKQLLTHVLGIDVIFEDVAVEQWGLKNFLVPLGGDMIEVVSPIKEGTTAGRMLEKRGEGGYMIIMETEDAKKRRDYIVANELAKVIFEHEYTDSVCIQYHPKGIKGGIMPELDSHTPSPSNPTPLQTRFSPWHACGTQVDSYTSLMKQSGHLNLEGCALRLRPGDAGHEAASRQWEEIFGVGRSRDMLAFTNARLGFIRGQEGLPEGLVSITVGVRGKEKLDAILESARNAGVCRNGWVDMCGIKWYFVLTGHDASKGKL
ncbi:hypothetical protein PtrSN002B_007770 [Pyrenophora tritici-repentis]|uniref:Uncharacterized protein n=2 Tax=Pyrenophora tritici-repentis TaxID=45151 RepID=A0A2W1HSG7_9PLEO|nr:uncharacterized protein PTRG_06830 [Pyrenophora tritici-repentis Pt-1C-BFP]KAA8613940.1 hypothetical protein PtrV1_12848 [Pyrenophora tritici-repentis]EDU49750.1 predicted protein [Pyrenophora tritici-repentis Pt-1C-BFP]KAF7445659.1 hypothetical protein A1F99_106450 [Pyrenophora tritici-repentis]KAF7565952.1 hypothetical protein PtrM4_053860 [Pyrenophora tritici-repentis]KAG9379968.1 hypothetical protein A1F94_008863 [Pyrenophora tritici-repentis]